MQVERYRDWFVIGEVVLGEDHIDVCFISKSLPALEILQALKSSYNIPARFKLDTQYKQVFCFRLLVRGIKYIMGMYLTLIYI